MHRTFKMHHETWIMTRKHHNSNPKKASKHMKDLSGITLMSIAGRVYSKMLVPSSQDLGRLKTV